MNEENNNECHYFLTYSGIKLPLKLVTPLSVDETENRNTFFRAYFDSSGNLSKCQKVVYGEIEFEHNYDYYEGGGIKQAQILGVDDEPQLLHFNENSIS